MKPVDINKKYETKEGTPVFSSQMGRYTFGSVNGEPVVWESSGAAHRLFSSIYDLIEVRTAEDVVVELLPHWSQMMREQKAAQIVQALRDEGKLRDGE